MYIAQDIVDMIIDQLSWSTSYPPEREEYLRATSLVSTVWVNRSQSHLFSSIRFYTSTIFLRWCSKIRPDPRGVSRHVRALLFGGGGYGSSLLIPDMKAGLPHFASFKNLQQLTLRRVNLDHTSRDILFRMFASFHGSLKRLGWTREGPIHETWMIIDVLAHLLPNLAFVDLSDKRGGTVQTQLSAGEGSRSP